MEYQQLGVHGLTVSNLGLGTRTWGLDTEVHEASEILRAFMTAGGTYVQLEGRPDYSEPTTVLGQELAGGVPREDLVIGLRSGFFPSSTERTPESPVMAGKISASRGALLNSLDAALSSLNTDYVDLWILSGPLGTIRLEEALGAMEFAHASGRARYVGLGGLSWWQAGAATASAKAAGWDFAAWSAEVSLLNPQVLSPVAAELRQSGMGIIAGSPLAGGVLTGKYRHSTPPDSRAASPRFNAEVSQYLDRGRSGIVEAVMRAAEGMDRSAAQISLAWVQSIKQVATAVVGPRTIRQLQHLLDADGLRLPKALSEVLTEVAMSQKS